MLTINLLLKSVRKYLKRGEFSSNKNESFFNKFLMNLKIDKIIQKRLIHQNWSVRYFIRVIIKVIFDIIILFDCQKLHYRQCQMSEKEIKEMEHDLLGSLLQDIQTINPPHKGNILNRTQASSAPPSFLQVQYKLDFDFLDASTFESPDPQDQNIMEAFFKKQTILKKSPDHEQHPLHNYRKMSCDSALYQYRDSNNQSSFSYYDYLNTYSPTEELFSNLDRVSEWARDQNGSRTVQDVFQNESQQRKDIIFFAIFNDAMALITDRFGNYVFQKIFQKGLQSHKQMLLNLIWGSINNLSMHSYGCRVIQKTLEYIKGRQQRQQKFMMQISPNCLMLIENQNGNHVIQKCFQVFPHERISQIVQIIKSNLNQLAYHTFGCRVIQKYIENYSQQKKCQQILGSLLNQSIPLSQCQFGNYVMQHIVTKCKQQRKKVFKAFLSKVFELSTNKYASNVMEKAIQASQSNFCEDLGQWFSNNPKELIYLSKHQFGNYVVQSMLNKIPKDKKGTLKTILKENASEISKSQHGRHVLLQLENPRNK